MYEYAILLQLTSRKVTSWKASLAFALHGPTGAELLIKTAAVLSCSNPMGARWNFLGGTTDGGTSSDDIFPKIIQSEEKAFHLLGKKSLSTCKRLKTNKFPFFVPCIDTLGHVEWPSIVEEKAVWMPRISVS